MSISDKVCQVELSAMTLSIAYDLVERHIRRSDVPEAANHLYENAYQELHDVLKANGFRPKKFKYIKKTELRTYYEQVECDG